MVLPQWVTQSASKDLTILRRLIEDHRFAVMPGRAFGATDACRLRIACGAFEKETSLQR